MSKKILVADDSKTIQRAVAIALEDEDVTVIAVTEPAQVVAQAQGTSPDLILLDNRMNANGVDDGYEIAGQLKAAVGHVPIVFLAGQSYDESKGDAVGAALAIAKPFDSGDFCEKVKSLLVAGPALASQPSAAPAQPVASIAETPQLRETTAIPAFRPTNPSALLPEDDSTKSGLTPPPMPKAVSPSSLLPSNEESSLNNVAAESKPLTPPPIPIPQPPPLSTPASPPVLEDTLESTPTVEYPTSENPSFQSSDAQRRAPLIIPPPSDEPSNVPVQALLQRAPTPPPVVGSPVETSDSEAAVADERPSFGLDPNQDFLARSLNGSRKWRRPAAAASSEQDSAQLEYIRQLSAEVVERIAWEVVPELAEIIIKEALSKQGQ